MSPPVYYVTVNLKSFLNGHNTGYPEFLFSFLDEVVRVSAHGSSWELYSCHRHDPFCSLHVLIHRLCIMVA